MTCASCAARIEKRLNRIDGVTATVNYATEQAKVHAPEAVGVDELIAQVEAAGYSARPARPATPGSSDDALTPVTDVDGTGPLRTRLITSIVLSVPVIVLAMVPAWQVDYWQGLSLTLAAPVVPC